MYIRVKKKICTPRKQDFRLPDDTVPSANTWIEPDRDEKGHLVNYFGKWNRARLSDIKKWHTEGKLIYIARVYYTVELRQSVKENGKSKPKNIKNWFMKNTDFSRELLKVFWARISVDLAELQLDKSEVSRINEKIAEHIPKK
jgi:hypothetical protein